MPRSVQYTSSPTRDQICAPAVEAWSPNHWTSRGVPVLFFKLMYSKIDILACVQFFVLVPV